MVGRLRRASAATALGVLATLPTASAADAQPNTTTRVSVTSSGEQSDDPQGVEASYNPAITPDGRYVAFQSLASNLAPPDTNRDYDIFVHDRNTGQTEIVSVGSASDGLPPARGNFLAGSTNVGISADGRHVTFVSEASTLLGPGGDLNAMLDVFVHDRQTHLTTRVSEASDGTEANGASTRAEISADGRYVSFESSATNLVAGDTNGASDVFVHELATGTTTRASVASTGAAVPGAQGNGPSGNPDVSGDGRYVSYDSEASNLASGSDSNGAPDVFVHDRQSGVTTRVSVSSGGAQAEGGSSTVPALTPDGRHVSFRSAAFNLVPGDTNLADDVFIHDRSTGTTKRVSVTNSGDQGNAHSGTNFRGGGDETYQAAMSAEGRYVAFRSEATNLVANDNNDFGDVFVHDRQTGKTRRASVANSGAEADAQSGELGLDISGDGRFVAFDSFASNLVEGDTNTQRDIFLREMAVDNALPVVSVGDVAVAEGDAGTRSAVFTLSLSGPAAGTVTVAYGTADASATKISDYTAKAGTASFAPGTTTVAVKVAVAGDGADETNETFTLGLSAPSGATLGDAAGMGTILDDDPASVAKRVAIGDVVVHEGDAGNRTAVFTVSLSKALTTTVTVNFATADGTASAAGDYVAKSGTVTIPAGAIAANVKVTVAPDPANEADETFTVTLSGSSGPTITKAVGTATVIDDD